jgi:hypothetical protein
MTVLGQSRLEQAEAHLALSEPDRIISNQIGHIAKRRLTLGEADEQVSRCEVAGGNSYSSSDVKVAGRARSLPYGVRPHVDVARTRASATSVRWGCPRFRRVTHVLSHCA